jgi:hypothetical protein
MEAWRTARIIVLLLALFTLASCGGDTGGGIGGTGFASSGTITAFGSIVVNDVEFDTTNADVIMGGEKIGTGNQAVLDNLDVGQAVVVEGTENNDGSSGTAVRVRFTPHVKGPVTEIGDLGNSTRIVVLGQTIIADEKTVFRNSTIGDLTLENLIEVSGLVEVAGAIRATHVKKLADSFTPLTEVKVKGMIRDLNSEAKTFKLNDLLVYYGLAAIGNLPEGTPKPTQLVQVKGKVGIGVTLIAAEIELADETKISNANRVVLEGFITEFTSISDFRVSYLQVETSGDTKFVGGQREELAAGVRIRVRGRLVDGILEAQQIFFRK